MELERTIGERLREKGMTLSVAESCTGGLVSDRITNISGSSDYFEGGVVSYGVQAKAKHLRIPLNYIKRFGAVSPQVAKKMAEGVKKAFQTTYGLSTTGVAGPTGGTKKTPVGTVFVAVADERRTLVEKLELKGSRREIKEEAAERCLRLLSKRLGCLVANLHGTFLRKGGTRKDWRLDQLSKSKTSEIVIIRKAPQGIANRKGRLGIFPASFNPPTIAHLALIREAEKQGHLDEVLVLLDIQAMDKEPVEATFEDRLLMMKKVFGKDPKISIGLSNRGLFIEKLKPLRNYYPSPISFFFIVGFDTILRILDRKYYLNRKSSLDELMSQSRFLVANRGNLEREAFEKLFCDRKDKEYRERVFFFTLPSKYASSSSSLIRKKVREGQPINGLVPVSVLRFIKERRLFIS